MFKIFDFIKNEFDLLVTSPRDYLYSYTISNDKKVIIKPYDKKAELVVKSISSRIKSVTPEVSVLLIGSTGLKIPGQNDIDLFISCDQNQIPSLVKIYSTMFGTPKKIRNTFVEWGYRENGFVIDLVLIDSKSKKYANQIKIFDILNRNKKIRQEYINLKKRAEYLFSSWLY